MAQEPAQPQVHTEPAQDDVRFAALTAAACPFPTRLSLPALDRRLANATTAANSPALQPTAGLAATRASATTRASIPAAPTRTAPPPRSATWPEPIFRNRMTTLTTPKTKPSPSIVRRLNPNHRI